jgi:hypothetical protein
MNPARGTARSIGVLYLLTMLPAPLSLIYLPNHFIVPGDAAATARNITAGELTYRLLTLAGLVNNILFIFLVLSLYNLFKEVDRRQARIMVLLVVVSVAVGLVTLIVESAPLILLSGADFLAPFSRAQLEALALGVFRLRGNGLGIATAFWGLWLLPFGILVIKSGFIPKLIGVLLIVGCIGYLAQSLTALLWPAQLHTVFNATLPLVGPGELSMIVWLLVKGGKLQLSAGEPEGARGGRQQGAGSR